MVPSPDRLLDFLSPWRDAPRWWIGLSGGLDSCVLLQLLAEARQAAARTSPLPTLTAVHVDHQLSAHSPGWSRHCEALCRSLEVELVIRRVVVAAGATGPEAAAREARYAVFEELVGPGDLLLLAHHLDDQVETLFLRLMRGAGTRGLAGMPRQRRLGKGELCRPLLAFTRESLEDFATERGLAWVEDESNCDLSPDRNYLRHRVLPRLEERWPAYRASVAASIDAVADAETALAALDQASLARARATRFGEPLLDLGALDAPAAGLARLLRRWLQIEGYAPPGRDQLVEFARQLREAEPDTRPALTGAGYCLRRYRDAVYLCRDPAGLPPTEPFALAPGQVITVPGLGRLEMRQTDGGGMRLPAAGHWVVRCRKGGERCRPPGRQRSQSLKKLLQESAVPPWMRQQLPLLYADGELAAVADLWVCCGQEAGDAPGYQLVWEGPERVAHD